MTFAIIIILLVLLLNKVYLCITNGETGIKSLISEYDFAFQQTLADKEIPFLLAHDSITFCLSLYL